MKIELKIEPEEEHHHKYDSRASSFILFGEEK